MNAIYYEALAEKTFYFLPTISLSTLQICYSTLFIYSLSQNGYVERFNRTYRTEVLDCYAFRTMEQAKVMTSAWMWMYNNERPHGSLAYNPPTRFALKYGYLKKEIPTFQHDINIDNIKNDWKSLVLNTTKTG